MAAVFYMSYRVTMWTVDAALETRALTLGELGQRLWGARGRRLLEWSQILFQQLFLPVAVVLSVDSLQAVFGEAYPWWACNVNVVLLLLLFACGMAQLSRQIGNLVSFAYASIALIGLQTVLILAYVGTHSNPLRPDSSADAAFGSDTARSTWFNLFGALGVFIYSCLPVCIVVETMAEMRDPREIKGAVRASFAFYVLAYLVSGVPVVLAWGGDVLLPITAEVTGTGGVAVLVNFILIYSTMLDFVIASTTVNRFLVARADPTFTYAWTRVNARLWALYTLPSTGKCPPPVRVE